mmetsp:Transcript_12641/g.41666  ORF Transcript_12641/g.41666 Transcript_12641/m.41666 type:complete len:170 (+) Transcript_12641:57-566(+)
MERQWRMLVMQEGQAKQDLWKRKVEHIVDETDSLRVALEKHFRKETRRQAEERERVELLTRVSNIDRAEALELGQQFDAEAQMAGSAQRSNRALDEVFETGGRVLEALQEQRDRLKSAHRKALDVLNSAGLSDSLLRVIDRRQKLDAHLVYGGMAVTVLFVFMLWMWRR